MYTTTPCSVGFGWLTVSGNHIVQYPLHLLNLSSVRALDSKIDKDEELRFLDPRRFRANLISKCTSDFLEVGVQCPTCTAVCHQRSPLAPAYLLHARYRRSYIVSRSTH